MSEYLYDEDYDPMDDAESSNGHWFIALCAISLALLLTKPLWINFASEYVAAFRHVPASSSGNITITVDPTALNAVREQCKRQTQTTFSLMALDGNSYVTARCPALKNWGAK